MRSTSGYELYLVYIMGLGLARNLQSVEVGLFAQYGNEEVITSYIFISICSGLVDSTLGLKTRTLSCFLNKWHRLFFVKINKLLT